MRQHLLCDGDDTLWQNNVYFERAIAQFIALLDHSTLGPAEVRAVLDEIEGRHGYGSANFARSLQECYARLAEREPRAEDRDAVAALARRVAEHPLEVIPGVRETLDELSRRHALVLVTKGAVEEQRLKIDGSGLADYFTHVLIVPEKRAATYGAIATLFDLDPRATWMIGNSPRSDINPALAAGLNAVYIPHPDTWSLEHEDVAERDDGRLLTLAAFAELRDRF